MFRGKKSNTCPAVIFKGGINPVDQESETLRAFINSWFEAPITNGNMCLLLICYVKSCHIQLYDSHMY